MTKVMRKIIHDIIVFIAPKWLRKKQISCKEVSIALTSELPPGYLKRLQVRMHIFICQCCSDHEIQLQIIKNETQKLSNQRLSSVEDNKAQKSKEEILKKYRSESD